MSRAAKHVDVDDANEADDANETRSFTVWSAAFENRGTYPEMDAATRVMRGIGPGAHITEGGELRAKHPRTKPEQDKEIAKREQEGWWTNQLDVSDEEEEVEFEPESEETPEETPEESPEEPKHTGSKCVLCKENPQREPHPSAPAGREKWCKRCSTRIQSYFKRFGRLPSYAPRFPVGTLKQYTSRARSIPERSRRKKPSTGQCTVKDNGVRCTNALPAPGGRAPSPGAETLCKIHRDRARKHTYRYGKAPAWAPNFTSPYLLKKQRSAAKKAAAKKPASTAQKPSTTKPPSTQRAAVAVDPQAVTLEQAQFAVKLVNTIGWELCELLAAKVEGKRV